MSNYNLPNYYHTFVSTPGVSNTSLNWPDVCQGNGYAAIAFDGALLIAVPRATTLIKEGDSWATSTWLQLQCNPLTLEQGKPTPLIEVVPPGSDYALTEPTNSVFIQPNLLLRPRIDLIAGAQPLVIWVESQPNNSVRVQYYFPIIQAGVLQPVDLKTVQSLAPMDFGPAADLVEFSVACINAQIFTFWSNASDPNFYLCILNYTDPQTLSCINNTIPLWQTPVGYTLLCFDAAVVYQSNATDFTGVTSANITIATLYQTGNGPLIVVRIMDSTTQSITELCSFAPPCACPPGSTIRVTWGSLPGSDPQATNGICVLVTPNAPDGLYFPYSDVPNFPCVSPVAGNPWITVVDISPTKNYGTNGGWTSLMPPLNNYSNEGLYSDDLAIGVNCASTVLCPIIDNATDGSANALYNVCFLGTACLTAQNWDDKWSFFAEIFTAPMPAFTMSYVAGSANATNQLTGAGTADVQAAISSWQLLGIVAGLPPYPEDIVQPTASVTIQYLSNNSESNTATSGSSLKAGGTLSICQTGVTVASSMAIKNSVTIALDNEITFDLDAVVEANTGWMLFYQPQYCIDQFQINTISGTPCGVVFEMLVQSTSNVGGYAAYPFNITQPNVPLKSDPISEILAQFPSTFTGWPSTTDPSAWYNYYDINKWALTETSPPMTLSAITSGQSVGESSLTCTTGQATQLNSSQSIKADIDCTIMKDVLGFQIGGSITTSLSNTVNASNTFSISVQYGRIGDNPLTLQPLFYQASTPNAPWVPTVVGIQQPWILMWEVTNDYSGKSRIKR